MNRADCPFCQPLPPGRILAEWDTFIAFFDGYPVPEGHALVIPRRHVASLFELPEHDYQQLWAQVAAAEALARLGTTAVVRPPGGKCPRPSRRKRAAFAADIARGVRACRRRNRHRPSASIQQRVLERIIAMLDGKAEALVYLTTKQVQ